MKKASTEAINLIKKWETLKTQAYICPAGKWTIGYGHTGSDVFSGKNITENEAYELLIKDIKPIENFLNLLINRDLSQNQFDALVSFVFNIGRGNFERSTLLAKLRKKPDDLTIHDEFLRWKYATRNGQKMALQGLLNRRREEAALYFKNIIEI